MTVLEQRAAEASIRTQQVVSEGVKEMVIKLDKMISRLDLLLEVMKENNSKNI